MNAIVREVSMKKESVCAVFCGSLAGVAGIGIIVAFLFALIVMPIIIFVEMNAWAERWPYLLGWVGIMAYFVLTYVAITRELNKNDEKKTDVSNKKSKE